jgi:hypothetical protein
MNRLLAVALVAGGFAAVAPAQAACGTLELRSEARASTTTPGVTFAMAEIQRFSQCDDGSQVLNETSGKFTVSVDGDIVCTRTDVDPSFDPFGFGAGLHMSPDDEGACAIGVTWSSFDPNLPVAEESGPQEGGVGVAAGKTVLAEGDSGEEQIHGLRLNGEMHQIADPNGLVFRKLVALPN